jgi:hypothetical protein
VKKERGGRKLQNKMKEKSEDEEEKGNRGKQNRIMVNIVKYKMRISMNERRRKVKRMKVRRMVAKKQKKWEHKIKVGDQNLWTDPGSMQRFDYDPVATTHFLDSFFSIYGAYFVLVSS